MLRHQNIFHKFDDLVLLPEEEDEILDAALVRGTMRDNEDHADANDGERRPTRDFNNMLSVFGRSKEELFKDREKIDGQLAIINQIEHEQAYRKYAEDRGLSEQHIEEQVKLMHPPGPAMVVRPAPKKIKAISFEDQVAACHADKFIRTEHQFAVLIWYRKSKRKYQRALDEVGDG